MSSTQKHPAGSRTWFAVAMGLAAVAGYGWGSMRDRGSADEGQAVSPASKAGERTAEVEEASQSVRGFVQSVVEGSVDDRALWRHVRSFTEAEVKATLAEMKQLDRYVMASWELQAMLYYRWAELDPVAANDAAIRAAEKGPFTDGFSHSRQAVIAAWINQGGAVAAWDAVREENEVWACTRSVPGEVSHMVAASLGQRDDAAAFKEVLRFNDENCLLADALCRTRAGKAVESPESRAAFLAAAATHPDPYVIGCAREQLFKAWAKKDVAAARAGALALSIDERSVESLNWMIDTVERDKKRDEQEAREAEEAAGEGS